MDFNLTFDPTQPITLATMTSPVVLAFFVWVLTQAVRKLTALTDAGFDRYGATIAIVVGIVIAELVMLASGGVTLATIVTAGLLGILGGFLSQNANQFIRRLTG